MLYTKELEKQQEFDLRFYEAIDRKRYTVLSLSYFEEYKSSALTRNDYDGFFHDYLALHCIIKKYNPSSIVEIGTNLGKGTNIICNAMQDNLVYSIDLPSDYNENKDVYANWTSEKPKDGVGSFCTFNFTQLFGNSKNFDFSPYYPIEAWFIDGRHNYEYAFGDSVNALKSNPKLIIWHDGNLDEVQPAIQDFFTAYPEYSPFYVENTRIIYGVKNG